MGHRSRSPDFDGKRASAFGGWSRCQKEMLGQSRGIGSIAAWQIDHNDHLFVVEGANAGKPSMARTLHGVAGCSGFAGDFHPGHEGIVGHAITHGVVEPLTHCIHAAVIEFQGKLAIGSCYLQRGNCEARHTQHQEFLLLPGLWSFRWPRP